MTAKEKIQAFITKAKALFDDVAPADTSTAVVFSYPVDGGSTVYVDCTDDGIPGIESGDMVYTDPALTIPYADGTYNVTGTQFGFTVASGAVTAVTDAAGTGPGIPLEQAMAKPPAPAPPPPAPAPPVAAAAPPPAPITPTAKMAEMTPETVTSFFAAFAVGTPEDRIANLELVAKALMEYNFGWQIREAQQKATADAAINIYKQDLATATTAVATAQAKMAKQDAKLKSLFDLVQEMAAIPSSDPKTLTPAKQEKFNKAEAKEARLEKFAVAIAEARKK